MVLGGKQMGFKPFWHTAPLLFKHHFYVLIWCKYGVWESAGMDWISNNLECCGSWMQDCPIAVQQTAQMRFWGFLMFWVKKTRMKLGGWCSDWSVEHSLHMLKSEIWRVMFWLKNTVSICSDWRVVFWSVFANSDCACVNSGPEVMKYHILLTVRKFSKCLEI